LDLVRNETLPKALGTPASVLMAGAVGVALARAGILQVRWTVVEPSLTP
jgi:hypothetical protein